MPCPWRTGGQGSSPPAPPTPHGPPPSPALIRHPSEAGKNRRRTTVMGAGGRVSSPRPAASYAAHEVLTHFALNRAPMRVARATRMGTRRRRFAWLAAPRDPIEVARQPRWEPAAAAPIRRVPSRLAAMGLRALPAIALGLLRRPQVGTSRDGSEAARRPGPTPSSRPRKPMRAAMGVACQPGLRRASALIHDASRSRTNPRATPAGAPTPLAPSRRDLRPA